VNFCLRQHIIGIAAGWNAWSCQLRQSPAAAKAYFPLWLINTNGHPSVITKGMVEKIAGSGLSYTDLEKTYRKFGQDGLFALLSKPPSSANTSAPKTTPRVTRTDRILAAIVQHFKDTVQITA
jgi:hypothetical protein